VLGVAATTVITRVIVQGKIRQALPVDAAALSIGSLLVFTAMRRSPGLSPRSRRGHAVLATILLLGAVRAGLWALGVSVQYANLVVLGLGALTVAGWRIILARQKKAESAATSTLAPSD
jgi:hypothetical protein